MFTFIHILQLIVGMVSAWFTIRLIIDIISCTAAYMKKDFNIIRYTRHVRVMLNRDTVLIIILWTIFIQLL